MSESQKGKDSLMKLLLSTTPGSTAMPSVTVSVLTVYCIRFNIHTRLRCSLETL